MDETKRLARIAGAWYIALFLTAPIALLYVPGKIVVSGDATATAENLRAHDGLVRLGIAAELVHQVLIVFVVLWLYRLFRPVDEHVAKQVVILGALVSVPIMFVNVLNEIAASILAQGAPFLAPFDRAELDSLSYLFMRLHSRGITIAQIFWGLWLIPFGRLIVRSGFIPKIFGYLLFLAAGGYLVGSAATLVLPELRRYVDPVVMPLAFGEVPIIFWLAIWGARVPKGESREAL